jgi:type I restriction enzyme R subunit
VDAISVLLDRPQSWSTTVLTDLRNKLATAPGRFTVENLQRAHELRYHKALVEIISMVKHAADEDQPLFTAAERVDRAFAKLTAGRTFTAEQQQWLDRIRQHLVANLSIDRDDFDGIPVFVNAGGWGRANKAFDGRLADVLKQINEAVAA